MFVYGFCSIPLICLHLRLFVIPTGSRNNIFYWSRELKEKNLFFSIFTFWIWDFLWALLVNYSSYIFYWKKITCDEDHNFWKWIIKRERDKNVTFNSKWPGLKSSNLYNYSMILQGVEIYSCIYITINGSSLKSRYRVITNGNHSGLWFIFTCKFAQDSIHVVLQVHANVLRYKINTSVIQICTLLHKN